MNMKDIVRLCVSLGLVCLIGAGALAYVNNLTDGPRKAAEQRALTEGLKLVLPMKTARIATSVDESSAEQDKVQVVEGISFYRAYDADGKEIGMAAASEAKGFGGMVKVLVGIDHQGKILNVIVTGHNETPGLGTQATDRKVRKSFWGGNKELAAGELPPNAFLDGYSGKEAKLVEVDGVTGATYSSKGVKNAVDLACHAYQILKHGLDTKI